LDEKNEESSYTQVGNNSSDKTFQEVYWRCVYIYFFSSKINNPHINHILFTNSLQLPIINGISIAEKLSQLEVNIIQLPLTFQTPPEYFSSWRNQFYIFDILKYIGAHYEEEDKFIILDSDCVWLRSAEAIMNQISTSEVSIYWMNFNEEEAIHGLTRRQMKSLYEFLQGHEISDLPNYAGGEWFGATVKYIRKINVEVELVWKHCISRFEQNLLKFNEEAHMLSYIYYALGQEGVDAGAFIRRIWTISSIRRDATQDDMNLYIWHCPSEKKYGIANLFYDIWDERNNYLNVPSGEMWIRYIGEYFGIPVEDRRKQPVDYQVGKQIELISQLEKDIYIFGSGGYGQSVNRLLCQRNITPSGFIDNNSEKWGTIADNLLIEGPHILKNSDFVIIASYASGDIEKQLIRGGFSAENYLIFSFYN
jgi:hypothetical protein